MEKTYCLGRERATLTIARNAATSKARLVPYNLAGRYALNVSSAETNSIDLADPLPLPIYATGSNPSFDDADDA